MNKSNWENTARRDEEASLSAAPPTREHGHPYEKEHQLEHEHVNDAHRPPKAAHQTNDQPAHPQSQGSSPPDALGRMEQEGHEDPFPSDLRKAGTFKVALIALVFLGLLVGLFLLGYLPYRARNARLEADSQRVQEAKPSVQVLLPKRTQAAAKVELPGNALPLQETSIYTRANGYLKALHADIGDHVHQGQLLAEIDTPEVDAQLAASKANVQQQEANVTKAQTDFELTAATLERYKGLFKTGGVTQQQLDERQNAFNQAQSTLQAANAAVASANADVQRLTALQGYEKVFAPFDGVIAARNYDIGALLSPTSSQQLFDVNRTDTLRVFINVPQSYATEVKIGQSASFIVRNYPSKPFTGHVSRSTGSLDPRTRTMRMQVDFPNEDGMLLAGMYGQVTLDVARESPQLVIPTSALVYNADGLRVAVVDGENKAYFQKIVVGRDFGTEVEVLDGLKGEEHVVANPGEQLADGVQVNVMAATQNGSGSQGGGRNGQNAPSTPTASNGAASDHSSTPAAGAPKPAGESEQDEQQGGGPTRVAEKQADAR